jgi:ribosomal protein S1
VVTRITKFGAFLELGGYEGLLHDSEISWAHRDKAEKLLKVGDEIEVKVISMEPDKVSVSCKALKENPVTAVIKSLNIGDVVKCKVIRHENFGSFVELGEGVEALIPISQMSSKRINKPSDVLNLGDELEAKVVKLDEVNNKISLSIKDEAIDTWDTDAIDLRQGDVLSGILENITEHGAFIRINNSVVGLIPISKIKKAKLELTNEKIGDEMEVRISNINIQAKKLSLEPINFVDDEPQKPFKKEFKEPRERSRKDKSSGDSKRQPRKDHSQDNDWLKYSTGYQSVPEDNPFNKL